MNEKTKVQVQGVPETMLQTLYARAQESKKPNHHIYDERAIEVVSRLDYDFSKAESDKAMSLGVSRGRSCLISWSEIFCLIILARLS